MSLLKISYFSALLSKKHAVSPLPTGPKKNEAYSMKGLAISFHSLSAILPIKTSEKMGRNESATSPKPSAISNYRFYYGAINNW